MSDYMLNLPSPRNNINVSSLRLSSEQDPDSGEKAYENNEFRLQLERMELIENWEKFA